MYSTKRFHPKEANGYLSIGDPYVKKSAPTDSRFKDKQFQTRPARRGQIGKGVYFSEYKYTPDTYQDSNLYRISQPREGSKRPKGFGSSDAWRRDEFTLHVRAQQWKELLSREHHFTREHTERNIQLKRPSLLEQYYGRTASDGSQSARRANQAGPLPHLFQTQVPKFLYDIGKENGSTPICNKCSRETFYCKHRVGNGAVTARRVGNFRTAAMQVGANNPRMVSKPTYGRKSLIKDFYDRGHLGSANF